MKATLLRTLPMLLAIICCHIATLHAGEFTREKMVTTRDDGTLVVNPLPVEEKFKNPWPAEMEETYIKNYNRYLELVRKNQPRKLNTYFENEKSTYGILMLHYLAAGKDLQIELLQQRDHQSGVWHKNTKGIDYYACFTIKHQMRKYFYFKDAMEPTYTQKMYDGAKAWTEEDPLFRPHYANEPGKQGWGPDAKNSWVDIRTTDNLQWMRETSVYLMAEETGNEQVRLRYKKRIARFTKGLYRIGTGEWDSENYFGHSIAPIHNLYDFAKDPEVKLLAKAALDWYYTALAVKYWRGGFNGPTKRDYNKVEPLSGSASVLGSIYFGENPLMTHSPEGDEVHVISSAYRPPVAVMHLAHKKFDKPLELFADKPHYKGTIAGQWGQSPSYYETQYIANSFQFGTLARGTQGDANGFKILVYDTERGAEMIQTVPGPDPHYIGSAKYVGGKLNGPGCVAQLENMAIYLVKKGASPWVWVLHDKFPVEVEKGILFIKAEKTWIAYMPINLDINGLDDKLTQKIKWKFKEKRYKKKKGETPTFKEGEKIIEKRGKTYILRKVPAWKEYKSLSALGKGGTYCGIATVIGEEESYGDYDSFKSAILNETKLDTSKLDDGEVSLADKNGKTVAMIFGTSLKNYKLLRDGEARSFDKPWYVYRPANGSKAPVYQEWLSGTLSVEAGGASFTCTVDDEGKVTFENK